MDINNIDTQINEIQKSVDTLAEEAEFDFSLEKSTKYKSHIFALIK
jgi:hypothetical protein